MTAFLERVRAELTGVDVPGVEQRRSELAAAFRLGGEHTAGPPVVLEVSTTSFPSARRLFRLCVEEAEVRPQLSLRRGSGTTTLHRLQLTAPPRELARAADTRRSWPAAVTEDEQHAAAVLRGALLVRGSCSEPGRPVHLELPVPTPSDAEVLGDAAELVTGTRPVVAPTGSGSRLVWKSGDAVGRLLAAVGAMHAFLAWDDRRLRRQVRADATRLANADAANVRRSVRAAASQLATVELAVAAVGWEALEDDLREIALARLANPDASLAELGELCDPSIGKSAVHRRLGRLAALLEP